MSVVTTIEPFTKIKGTRKTRVIIILALYVISSLIAIFSTQDFLALYGKFLQVLLFFMIPWTCINLVDFYFVRHGKYNIEAIFDLNGEYGRWNWTTIIIYFVTVAIEVPFVNLNWYVGPIANALGGADLAWIVGGLFSAISYYVLARRQIKTAMSVVQ